MTGVLVKVGGLGEAAVEVKAAARRGGAMMMPRARARLGVTRARRRGGERKGPRRRASGEIRRRRERRQGGGSGGVRGGASGGAREKLRIPKTRKKETGTETQTRMTRPCIVTRSKRNDLTTRRGRGRMRKTTTRCGASRRYVIKYFSLYSCLC